MANLVTLSRFFLVVVVILLAYGPPTPWRLLAVPLLAVAFITDAVDGYLARRRGEASIFGAMLDIAIDRIVEISLWVVLADLDLVPVWVPLVFVARGGLVDTIRGEASARGQLAPFDTISGRIGRFIVAGAFMRTFYAVVKAVTFCWLLLMHAAVPLWPEIPVAWVRAGWVAGEILVLTSVALCLARAMPVITEYLALAAARRSGNA